MTPLLFERIRSISIKTQGKGPRLGGSADKVGSIDQLCALTCDADFSNFKNVKEEVFLRRLRRRYFHAPSAGHHILAVRRLNFGKIGAPKCLPHATKFRIFGHLGPFLRFQWPILAATPPATVFIPGAKEIRTRATAARYHAVAWQQ